MLDFLKKMLGKTPHFSPLGLVPNEAHDNDPRNLRYDEISPLGAVSIPEFGNVERNPWTLNQFHSSSCTCHATVQAVHNTKYFADKFFSPRYAFKKIKTDPKYASSQLAWGAYQRDSLLLKINEGICEYALCPNEGTESDPAYLNFSISASMEANAGQFKGGAYVYVTDGTKTQDEKFDDIIRYMAEQKEGVKVAVTWRSSFNDARRTGIVPAVMPSGELVGHDMFAVAWKKINGHLYMGLRNSFGKDWGDNGMVWLPKGFFKITAAMAYIAPTKPLSEEIISPPVIKPEEKNTFLEQANALELRKMLLKDFPLDVVKGSQEANMVARSLAGKWWLVLPKAVTYRGWTVTDVKNWLYAHSREKKTTKAYKFDFNKVKE